MRSPALRLDPRPVRPLAERGRILFASDVQELYGKRPDGRWRRTHEWVLRFFAPEYRHKDGREVYWWEVDALRWMDRKRQGAA